MMKKIIAFVLAAQMILTLAACGSKPAESAPSLPPQEEEQMPTVELSFRVDTTEWSESAATEYEGQAYTLIEGYCSLPKLVPVDGSGEEFSIQGNANSELSQLRAAANFNATMEQRMAKLQEAYRENLAYADELFPQLMSGEFPWWQPMAEDIHSYIYENGDLVSVVLVGYSYLGGAHPNSYFERYNFDLAAGEFVEYEDLAASEEEFRMAVAEFIRNYIYASGLNEGYYDDFESYLFDLAYTQMSFDGEGMTVSFDEYTMGPHAAGIPTFLVPYDIFCDYLNDYGRALLAVSDESFALADHREAVELWGWFHMTTLPLDYKQSVESDGYTYYRVQDIATMGGLRTLLTSRVSEELADAWLAENSLRYKEIDGVLYGLDADRGSSLELGSTDYTVEFAGDGGKVIGTTKVYDTNQWDHVEKDFVVIDTLVTEYPFDWVDGEAIFTDFPYPY